MSDIAREILVTGAAALARTDGIGPSLQLLLGSIASQLDVGSAAIFTVDRPSDRPQVVATFRLEGSALAALAEAVTNPNHPIARTIATPKPTFNVLPTAPGGPVLRSHLPLIVTRGWYGHRTRGARSRSRSSLRARRVAGAAGERGSGGGRDRATRPELTPGASG